MAVGDVDVEKQVVVVATKCYPPGATSELTEHKLPSQPKSAPQHPKFTPRRSGAQVSYPASAPRDVPASTDCSSCRSSYDSEAGGIPADRVREILYEELGRRLQTVHGPDVIYTRDRVTTVNVAALQQVSLGLMQQRLVAEAFCFKYDDEAEPRWSDKLANRLHQYVQAVQDANYMDERCRTDKTTSPFLISTTSALGRRIIEEAESQWREYIHDSGEAPPEAVASFDEDMVGLRSDRALDNPLDADVVSGVPRRSAIRRYASNIAVAFAGIAFIVAPAAIMLLNRTVLGTLVTASAFAVGFALVATVFLAQPRWVVAAVTAYAAVLVLVLVSVARDVEEML